MLFQMTYTLAIEWRDQIESSSNSNVASEKIIYIMYKCKNWGNKFQELSNLKFSGRLFVSESMSHENQHLAYKCRQLKSARKIHSTWFFNNVVNLKLTEHGRIHKIFHVTDIENLLEIDNLEDYINNISFYLNC